MADILVVANQTLGGEELLSELRRRVEQGPTRLHVVVPSNTGESRWTHTHEESHRLAQERLDMAQRRFAELGAEVDGEVGDERPLDAVDDALRRWDCDEIIVSTLPVGASRWLRMDLVSRLQRAYALPVTHVAARATAAT